MSRAAGDRVSLPPTSRLRLSEGGSRTAAFAIVLLFAFWAIADPVLAQTGPFGVPRPSVPQASAAEGLGGWILTKQAEFYRGLSALIRAMKTDGSAAWTLLGLSFLYGVFHAAGPGHGKAVISSYLLANEETWRRGVALSFASAMLQAVVAVAVVGIAAVLLGATAKTMGDAVRIIEMGSYALIAAIGARLLWVKGRALLAAVGERFSRAAAPVGAAVTGAATTHDYDYHHQDGACENCGHAHGPEPKDLAGTGGWSRGLAAIVAVGLRPCSGAILVLVFSLAQGLFWAGVASTFAMGLGTAITVSVIATFALLAKGLAVRFASTRSGFGTMALGALEVFGALLVLGFGLALFAGYLANERLML